jgi:AcrR family transcriptional regulator
MKTSQEQADLRVRRTHKLLWEALMALLAERAFEAITVKDICERAMVHRTTFYKHYEDKYALLAQGMREMYDVLLRAEEHIPPCAFSIDDPPPYFVRLFTHVAEHQQFYKLMLCGEGIGRFQKLLKDYIIEQGETKVPTFAPVDQKLSVPRTIHLQFMAGAVISTLIWWLENDMPHSPQQMAQYLLVLHGHQSNHL